MAYAATVTVTRVGSAVKVTIAETECAATSEATIALGFKTGRLLRQIAVLTSGSGSTIDPIIGTATNPATATGTAVAVNDTAAAAVDNLQPVGVPFMVSDGKLYHRSVPNSGTNNVISTTYYISTGF